MGSYRKLSRAQLRQQARDQQDPAWLAWLAEMDPALEPFFAVDVPDMPADPFSVEGVAHAEQAALVRFSAVEVVLQPEIAAVVDRFHRYLGEAFVRCFEGRWMNVQVTGDPGEDRSFQGRGFNPVVREPFTEAYTDVVSLLFMAVHRRTGHEWTSIYAYSEEDYAEWLAVIRGGARPE